MILRHLVHIVSITLLAVAVALGITALVSLLYGDGDARTFVFCAAGTAIVGLLGQRTTALEGDLSIREGYAVVSLSWIAIGTAGAIPYLATGVVTSPAAALFESFSGFTTTGASVFTDIEALPHGILLWRSLTQWIGGMGIVVLGIAILPFLGVGGMQLFRAEVPGPTPERLRPRIAQTAKVLWVVYTGLTVAQILLYLVGGMAPFEAVLHALTTVSTGGFSPRNASMAAYDSAYIHYVTIAFMYLAGVNFALHYRALLGNPHRYVSDSEWKFFTLVLLGATAIVTAVVLSSGNTGFEEGFRNSLFQVVSIATTTGFGSYDYELWPPAVQMLLLLLMFMGGMAGSTAGGMKAIRVYILFRHALTEIKHSIHPRAVLVTRVGRRALQTGQLLNILAFILLFFVLFAGGTLALTLTGVDTLTAIGAAASAIGNIGPGLGDVGPAENYGWMGAAPQLILVFLMLVGRLELFTILLLFHRSLWKRASWSGK
ncbi:MAG: TrkH family potassium uptake protein [Gemmatimonadetes bacterium]|nr:TrkH family potassium uptake protein [Gemmatimonadota bacterium]